MRWLVAALCALLTATAGCQVVHVTPGPGVLQAQTGQGNLVILEPGQYGDQTVNGDDTGFIAKDGAELTSLNHHGDDVLYTGFDIDAQFVDAKQPLDLSGDHVGLHNSRVGNGQNEKNIVSGADITLDHVTVHDMRLTDSTTHMEGIYALDVPGLTIRDSLFERNDVFDVFFTHRTWECPCPGGYGDVTLENNRFLGGITYSVMAAHTDTGPFFGSCPGSSPGVPNGFLRGWRVVDNTFAKPTAYLLDCPARWDGFVASGNVGG